MNGQGMHQDFRLKRKGLAQRRKGAKGVFGTDFTDGADWFGNLELETGK